MTIALNLIIAVIGLVMMFVSTNAKVVRTGEIMFFCGLLAFLLSGAAGKMLHA
jgi:hypothetical protein